MAEDRVREASCACGQLKIRLRGEPEYVSSCACQQCQRRTGSPYGVTAFFLAEQVVSRAGEAAQFRRTAESGNDLTFRFCPNCGSTVWWEPHGRPGRICVAWGAFADPEFPPPQRLIWTDHKPAWVGAPPGAPEFPRGPTPR